MVRAMLDCAPFFDYRLPEHFAGYDRSGDEPPVSVPASARPQAWAAATPVLLLRALLGVEPDPVARVLCASATELPAWAEGLTLAGVPAFGRRWDVRVDGGAASAQPSG